ncbi:NgoMIV family type II restriction endonuclease [Propionibacterium sp. oral taxon 192]|uniref:NgoMIV family type II restriction endonuclease n=1 Tax=Propionibacterium sp. oral taxon 192 TaxID=671222 RepID=UPI003FA422FF
MPSRPQISHPLRTRIPEPDLAINRTRCLVDDETGRWAVIRQRNQQRPIVHAVVSCKWTLRSDRAQSTKNCFPRMGSPVFPQNFDDRDGTWCWAGSVNRACRSRA